VYCSALQCVAARETADGRLCDTLDLIVKHLAVTFVAALAETFTALATTGHFLEMPAPPSPHSFSSLLAVRERGPAQSEDSNDSRFGGPRALGAAVRCEHFKKHSKNQNTQQERGPKPELPSPYLSEDVCCRIVDVYQCVVGEVSCTSL